MTLTEVCIGMLYHIGAFASSVSYEQTRPLGQIFRETAFVYDDGSGFFDLYAVGCEHGCIDFHAAGVYHRDYEVGIPGQAGDDGPGTGDDGPGGRGGLGYQGVKGTDGQKRLPGAEA